MKSMSRLAIAVAFAAFAAPALAQFTQTTTSTFAVNATVQRTCAFVGTSAPLAFPTYDTFSATPVTASTTFQFRCNRGTTYAIGIERGAAFGLATGFAGLRAMQNGTNYLAYELFSDGGLTAPWGGTVGTDTVASPVSGAPSNAPVTLTIYGRIPALQDVPALAYTDAAVQITVHY